MAKATGKLIDKGLKKIGHFSTINKGYAWEGDTVTIELPRNMRVIGKREDCKGYSKGSSNFWIRCKTFQEFVASRYCPCHSWKVRKA